MANIEDRPKSPAESTVGDDAGHSSTGKGATAKDKQCQYCHQAFTSSSLGRHLDQYLFKKKPDGIHDVEEIRRVRSSITRRQARSSTKYESPDVGTRKDTNDSPSGGTHESPARPRQGPRYVFNTPSWHATGVINNIPESSSQNLANSIRGLVSRSPVLPDYAGRNPKVKDADTVRALELALQEVLDNVRAATAINRPRLSPFEFDVQAETFPSLALKLLPPPATLFATQPFPTSASFPLEPPGAGHLDLVRNALKAHIETWRNERLGISSSLGNRTRTSHNNDAQAINATAQQHEDLSARHLEMAYQNWMLLSTDVQKQTWQLEITRAFVRESGKRKDLESQLNRVQQEVEKLREQNERLQFCQWPREFALFPPETLPLSRDTARQLDELSKSQNSPGSSRWDYDQLVAKWKRVVMQDKSMGRAGASSSYKSADDAPPRDTTAERPNLNGPESEVQGEFSTYGYVAPPTTNSAKFSGQHANPYEASSRSASLNGYQGMKRQRLMNVTSKDADPSFGNNRYKAINPPSGSGNAQGWSPASVQSLLSSTNPPSTSISANPNRYTT